MLEAKAAQEFAQYRVIRRDRVIARDRNRQSERMQGKPEKPGNQAQNEKLRIGAKGKVTG